MSDSYPIDQPYDLHVSPNLTASNRGREALAAELCKPHLLPAAQTASLSEIPIPSSPMVERPSYCIDLYALETLLSMVHSFRLRISVSERITGSTLRLELQGTT
jgi:hypothetical protein